MQGAGVVFLPYVPYVAGLFDELWTPEERAQKWKERRTEEIRECADAYEQ